MTRAFHTTPSHTCTRTTPQGGPTKEEAPVSMLLQSGDILIMGGAARMSVHGVPKVRRALLLSFFRALKSTTWPRQVFTAALPPPCLRPATAGTETVHRMGCPLFLAHNGPVEAGPVDKEGTGDGDSGGGTATGKRAATATPAGSDEGPEQGATKRHRLADDGYAAASASTSSSSSGGTAACTCGGLPSREERRALAFLHLTRLNINVRQVHLEPVDTFVAALAKDAAAKASKPPPP